MPDSDLREYGFPDLQCRSPTRNLRANCIARAQVEKKLYSVEDGELFGLHYRCEYGHGFTVFVPLQEDPLPVSGGQIIDG